jgi:hypothetical protein
LHGRIEKVIKVISCGGTGKTHNQTIATVLEKNPVILVARHQNFLYGTAPDKLFSTAVKR